MLSSRSNIKKIIKSSIGRKLVDYLSMNESMNQEQQQTLAQRMLKAEIEAKQRQCSVTTLTYTELEKSGMNLKETIRNKE